MIGILAVLSVGFASIFEEVSAVFFVRFWQDLAEFLVEILIVIFEDFAAFSGERYNAYSTYKFTKKGRHKM